MPGSADQPVADLDQGSHVRALPVFQNVDLAGRMIGGARFV
jgi:hypothetical protein